jgi:hypothetical protein
MINTYAAPTATDRGDATQTTLSGKSRSAEVNLVTKPIAGSSLSFGL